MKRILLITICLMLTSCSMIDFQVKDDTQLVAIASFAVQDLARHVVKNHPKDVDGYINYCDAILALEDKDTIEEYFNYGVDRLIERNVSNPVTLMSLTAVRSMFTIDVDTNKLDLDSGDIKTVLSLVTVFKESLIKYNSK